MVGRVVGVIVGVAMALFGYGLLSPQALARVIDLSHVDLGPFGLYRPLVAGMIVVLGAAVSAAAAQRTIERKKTRKSPSLFDVPEDAAAAPEPSGS